MSINFRANVGFEWVDDRGNSILLKYEFPDPQFKISPSDNIIFKLWANQHAESQIYPVTFDGGSTCGWLLTASAIESAQIPEQYRNDRNFRIAAWAVARYLAEQNKVMFEAIAAGENRYEFRLADCIDQELSLLTLYRPMAPAKIVANAALLIPKLLTLGLIPYLGEFSKKILRPAFSNDARVLNINTNIPEHGFQTFYNDLLTRYIPSVDDAAFKFYLYYQIIETMMEDVLVDSAKVVLQDLTSAQGNVVAIRDSLEKYQKISSESARIKKIFSVLGAEECANLLESCANFLESVDSEFKRANHVNEGAAFFIYKVRNQLIHNFRRAGSNNLQLEQINFDLEDLIPRLIYEFGSSRQAGTV